MVHPKETIDGGADELGRLGRPQVLHDAARHDVALGLTEVERHGKEHGAPDAGQHVDLAEGHGEARATAWSAASPAWWPTCSLSSWRLPDVDEEHADLAALAVGDLQQLRPAGSEAPPVLEAGQLVGAREASTRALSSSISRSISTRPAMSRRMLKRRTEPSASCRSRLVVSSST